MLELIPATMIWRFRQEQQGSTSISPRFIHSSVSLLVKSTRSCQPQALLRAVPQLPSHWAGTITAIDELGYREEGGAGNNEKRDNSNKYQRTR